MSVSGAPGLRSVPAVRWRLATAGDDGGELALLVVDEDSVDLRQAASIARDEVRTPGWFGDLERPAVLDLLRHWDAASVWVSQVASFVLHERADWWRASAAPARSRWLAAPVPRPPKLLYAAANYRAHILEQLRTLLPDGTQEVDKSRIRPYFFSKPQSAVSGPFDAIPIPSGVEMLDWEVELAMVIGRGGWRIPAARAMEHVAGFLVADDLTCRDLVVRKDWPLLGTDWLAGKGFPGFAPLGPYLVPRVQVADPLDLRLQLRVNGQTKQDANSAEMVFTPEEQIEFVSSILPLEPGDVISTGTPAGVGFSTGTFLQAGDVIEAEVEGLGCQRTPIVEEGGGAEPALKDAS